MSANLSVEQSLMKAKSHVKKGDLAEAQKLYETILQNISNNIRTQKEIGALNNPIQNNIIQNALKEGFLLNGKIDMMPVQYENQYLYILQCSK